MENLLLKSNIKLSLAKKCHHPIMGAPEISDWADFSSEGTKMRFSCYYKSQKHPKKSFFTFGWRLVCFGGVGGL